MLVLYSSNKNKKKLELIKLKEKMVNKSNFYTFLVKKKKSNKKIVQFYAIFFLFLIYFFEH